MPPKDPSTPRRSPLRSWLGRLMLVPLAVLLTLVGVEVAFHVLNLDGPMLNRSLYWQGSDLAMYQTSADPVLLYELRPGARISGQSAQGQPWEMSVNRWGARGTEPPDPSTRDAFRVFFFGASTLFGAGVSDQETLAAALEREISSRVTQTPVEVWNFGTSGYVVAQSAHLARNQLARHKDVDLVLLLPTNQGRRPFLGGPDQMKADHRAAFRGDPVLYLENFPAPPGVAPEVHQAAMTWLATYRYWTAWQWSVKKNNYGDARAVQQVTKRELDGLGAEARARKVPVVLVFYPRKSQSAPPNLGQDWPSVDLHRASSDPLFSEIHPPAHILALHAANLAESLQAGGFLPVPGP